jgi:hypothetical protein
MTSSTSGSFLVESYSPDPTAQADRLAGRPGLTAGVDGPVVYRGSISVPADEVAMHLFEGPDAVEVAAACRDAGVTPDRVVPIVTTMR